MRKNFMCIGVSILVLAAQIQTHAYDVWVVPAQPISEEKMNRIIKDLPQEVLQNEVHPYTDNQLRNSISEQVRDSLSQLAVKGESESRLGHEKEALLAYENILLTLRDKPLSQGLNKLIIFALLKSAEIYEKKRGP